MSIENETNDEEKDFDMVEQSDKGNAEEIPSSEQGEEEPTEKETVEKTAKGSKTPEAIKQEALVIKSLRTLKQSMADRGKKVFKDK